VCTDASSEIKSPRAGFRVPLSFRPPLFGTLPQSVVTENQFLGSQVASTFGCDQLIGDVRFYLSKRHGVLQGLGSSRVASTRSASNDGRLIVCDNTAANRVVKLPRIAVGTGPAE
jgi:hypothetical protein